MQMILGAVLGYLFGCFNPAYFLAKAKGFDIHEKGSGNAGASNTVVTLGWGYGIFVALFDISKAAIAVLVVRYLVHGTFELEVLTGVSAVLGHIFPFYLHFKGGKGYASYTGMMLVLNWKVALAMILYGILTTLVTDFIALATITTAIIYPFIYWYLGATPVTIGILAVVGVVMVYKHKINLQRIAHKEEIGLFRVNQDKKVKEKKD